MFNIDQVIHSTALLTNRTIIRLIHNYDPV